MERGRVNGFINDASLHHQSLLIIRSNIHDTFPSLLRVAHTHNPGNLLRLRDRVRSLRRSGRAAARLELESLGTLGKVG